MTSWPSGGPHPLTRTGSSSSTPGGTGPMPAWRWRRRWPRRRSGPRRTPSPSTGHGWCRPSACCRRASIVDGRSVARRPARVRGDRSRLPRTGAGPPPVPPRRAVVDRARRPRPDGRRHPVLLPPARLPVRRSGRPSGASSRPTHRCRRPRAGTVRPATTADLADVRALQAATQRASALQVSLHRRDLADPARAAPRPHRRGRARRTHRRHRPRRPARRPCPPPRSRRRRRRRGEGPGAPRPPGAPGCGDGRARPARLGARGACWRR